MKKLILLFGCSLSACVYNPDVVYSWSKGEPVYHKVQECYFVDDFPQSYQQWNQILGRYDTYVTTAKSGKHVECNYDVSKVKLYGTFEEDEE